MARKSSLPTYQSIVGIFKNVSGVVTEPLRHWDEVHWNQEGGQGQETEGTLPSNSWKMKKSSSIVTITLFFNSVFVNLFNPRETFQSRKPFIKA